MNDKTLFDRTRLETARLSMPCALYTAPPLEAGEMIFRRILNDFHIAPSLDAPHSPARKPTGGCEL